MCRLMLLRLLLVGLHPAVVRSFSALAPHRQGGAWDRHFKTATATRLASTRRGSSNLVTRQKIAPEPSGDTPKQQEIQVLSEDPLVYLIPNLLSLEECEALKDYVTKLPDDARPMTRSNPPEVSLDRTKLWPLPLFSLLSALPPIIRRLESSSTVSVDWRDLALTGLPNVLTALAISGLLAVGVVLPLMRQVASSSSRTSDAVALNQAEDKDAIQSLVDRITARTTHPWDKWEAPVVTRYEAGAVFAKHGDASPTRGSEWADLGGQRVITCICYLKTLSEGSSGETYFDKLSLVVPPKAGTGLVFFPADSESWVADERTTHESLPPMEEKWIVQMFGRSQRVPPPLGLPDSHGRSGKKSL
jgi:hypothetical protein